MLLMIVNLTNQARLIYTNNHKSIKNEGLGTSSGAEFGFASHRG